MVGGCGRVLAEPTAETGDRFYTQISRVNAEPTFAPEAEQVGQATLETCKMLRRSKRVSREINANQFAKGLRQLSKLNLIVVKSPTNGPDTIELHPVIKEFIRRQFTHTERSHYISAIVVFLDQNIVKLRSSLDSEVSYHTLQIWTAKAELLINCGEYLAALLVL